MHVRAGLARRRHAVDRAGGLAVDEDDALVALRHVRQELLHDQRLAAHRGEELVQRGEVAVVRVEPEHARAAVAVERFQDDVAVPRLEGAQDRDIARDGGGRRQVGKIQHQQLLGRIPHPERIVDHEGPALEPVEDGVVVM
jgi:hypothetical protein